MRIRIGRPILFVVLVGTLALASGVQESEFDTAALLTTLSQKNAREPSNADMFMARERLVYEKLSKYGKDLSERLKTWPKLLAYHVNNLFVIGANSWLRAGESRRTAIKIIALNTTIFLAWRIHRLQPFMMANFTHYALSGKSYTLLTSVFSHATFWHLLFNSVALFSFAPTAYRVFFDMNVPLSNASGIKESTPLYHFITFYVTGGLVSSLVSHLSQAARLAWYSRRLNSPVGAALALQRLGAIRPSLGASGALYAMIMGVAIWFPHTSVNIMFVPVDIPISAAVSGTVLLDIIGVLRGWKTFDHMAHLGGAAFGLWYFWWNQGRLWDSAKQA